MIRLADLIYTRSIILGNSYLSFPLRYRTPIGRTSPRTMSEIYSLAILGISTTSAGTWRSTFAEPDPSTNPNDLAYRSFPFVYPDQNEFPPKRRLFDCEALFWADGSLFPANQKPRRHLYPIVSVRRFKRKYDQHPSAYRHFRYRASSHCRRRLSRRGASGADNPQRLAFRSPSKRMELSGRTRPLYENRSRTMRERFAGMDQLA